MLYDKTQRLMYIRVLTLRVCLGRKLFDDIVIGNGSMPGGVCKSAGDVMGDKPRAVARWTRKSKPMIIRMTEIDLWSVHIFESSPILKTDDIKQSILRLLLHAATTVQYFNSSSLKLLLQEFIGLEEH